MSTKMERIYVAVRARPLSPEDAKTSPWRISSDSICLTNQSSRFDFDRIFGEECKTNDLYLARTKDIVASAISGFNGTVFAYGQTSSGKTHTMKGTKVEPGIIPLAINDLFEIIEKDVNREFLVRMSYMEIYNEDINDLLVPEHRKLQIHENIERGIFVAGLKEEIVTSSEQVIQLMEFGESHRHIGETNMNLYSSRSHTIFRMVIESREKVEDGSDINDSTDAVRVSILNLVDLAGSERAAKTGAEGVRFREGSHINKSLLTLGTVIKKLSEGAESQGGHVPYRDSKLTRILQPALGGNANTAMICNITLAQIHADETKSSLKFASRALRVKNCACVNEILTDAALLKRQRKEIEELRAKLKSSHNEHWEEEILNLRNTLLQSELEKERILLELEEEKKEKAEREKRLVEQAKKIENLSSLVLFSDRDGKTVTLLKSQKKRRLTWCSGPFASQLVDAETSGGTSGYSKTKHRASSGSALVPLVPFQDLMDENGCFENRENSVPFPDEMALLNVTRRRKVNTKKRVEPNEMENPLNESDISPKVEKLTMRESEAILVIKQLEDQIKFLELEKASIQHNLDDVVELATQQNNSFTDKYKEMQDEVTKAQEEARLALETKHDIEILEEIQGLELQIGQSKRTTENLLSFVDENFSFLSKALMDLKSSASQDISLFKSKFEEFEILTKQLSEKCNKLDSEKGLLQKKVVDCENEIEKLKCYLESHEKGIAEVTAQHELEKEDLIGEVLNLRKEVSYLSSLNSVKENESLRKELERTKTKLKDADSKLKNSIHEKNKLESEKVQAGREIKQLTSQMALLERDIRKNELKKESVSNIDKNFLNEYQNLGVHAIQMEGEMAALQEHLILTMGEKEEAFAQIEILNSELQQFSHNMNSAVSEIQTLKEEAANLTQRLREAESLTKSLEASVDSLKNEKDEMAMQLTDVLLEAEAEKSQWLAKEKVFIHDSEKMKIFESEIQSLSNELSEAKRELEVSSEQYMLRKATIENTTSELRKVQDELNALVGERDELLLKINEMSTKLAALDNYKDMESQLEALKIERDNLLDENNTMGSEAEILKNNYDNTISQVRSEKEILAARITELEAKMRHDALACHKEATKDKLRVRALQQKSDTFEGNLEEVSKDRNKMKECFNEQANGLKEKLRKYGTEILKLKKLLAENKTEISTLKEELASRGNEISRLKNELPSNECSSKN